MVRRSRRVALVALAIVAVVGFPAVGVGEPDGATSRASASSPLTTDLLTTTELLTTTVETPTLTETTTETTTAASTTTETSTAETSTTTETTTDETTTALVTTTVDSPTNGTDELTNGTDDLTNGTDELTNETDSTGNLTNSTDELVNATNASGELTGSATDSLLTVSTVDARGHVLIASSSVTGTATGTLEEGVAVASDPLEGSDSTDEPSSSDDGTRTENGTGAGAETSTESDATTAAGGSSPGATASASGASDRSPARDERGGPADGPELVVGLGALTAAALVPQLADGLALLVNADGVPASSAAASSTFGVRRTLRSRFDRFWRFVAPFRYSRWDDSDPLDHEVREALYEAIDRSPGAYLSEVADRADVALSTARHHLDVLEDEGLVTTAKVRGKRRYYPDHAPDVELTAALEDEGTAEVLRALARLGASHGGRLADELDRDASTVSHHLSRLEDAGLVEREREGRAVVNRLAPEVRAVLRGDAEPDGETPAVAD